MRNPVLGPSVMAALRSVIRACPAPLEIADGRHFYRNGAGRLPRPPCAIGEKSNEGNRMKLYYARNSRAVRVAWVLEEMGLDYEIQKFELGDRAMRAPEYRSVHPMGRVPALEDREVTLFESGAIIQYLLARYSNGHLAPTTNSSDFPDYLQWFHYAEGMIMPPMNTLVVETILLPPERRTEVNVKRATKLLNQMLAAVDQRMARREYLTSQFTAADIMTGHAVIMAAKLGADLSDKPNLPGYIDRLRNRPALKVAWTL
jgi:glutathione S-transferase